MANKNPKTEHLKTTQFDRADTGAISHRATGVNLEVDVYEAIQRMDGKTKAAWLRRVIREAAEREDLL